MRSWYLLGLPFLNGWLLRSVLADFHLPKSLEGFLEKCLDRSTDYYLGSAFL